MSVAQQINGVGVGIPNANVMDTLWWACDALLQFNFDDLIEFQSNFNLLVSCV